MSTAVLPTIKFEDFAKVDLRLGRVFAAERVHKSNKLLKLQVSFGDFERQIVAGIGKTLEPADLVGKQYVFCVNLEPVNLMGEDSAGMILASGTSENLVLFGAVESKYTSCRLENAKILDGSKLG